MYSTTIYTTQHVVESKTNEITGCLVSAAFAMPLEGILYGRSAMHGMNRAGIIATAVRDIGWTYSISKIQKNNQQNPVIQIVESTAIGILAGITTFPADVVRAHSITSKTHHLLDILKESAKFLLVIQRLMECFGEAQPLEVQHLV